MGPIHRHGERRTDALLLYPFSLLSTACWWLDSHTPTEKAYVEEPAWMEGHLKGRLPGNVLPLQLSLPPKSHPRPHLEARLKASHQSMAEAAGGYPFMYLQGCPTFWRLYATLEELSWATY